MRVIIIVLAVVAFKLSAATEPSANSKIKELTSYTEYGGGDVIVKLEINGSNCTHGYWFKKSDPGFDANLSMLIAAYHSNSNIEIHAHDNQIWGGSSGTYCHAYSIRYQKK